MTNKIEYVGATETVNFYCANKGLLRFPLEAIEKAAEDLGVTSNTVQTVEVPVEKIVEVTVEKEVAKQVYVPVILEGAFEFVKKSDIKEHELKAMIKYDPFSAVTELAMGKYIQTVVSQGRERIPGNEISDFMQKFGLYDTFRINRQNSYSSSRAEAFAYWQKRLSGLRSLYLALLLPNSPNGMAVRQFLKDFGIDRVEQCGYDRPSLVANILGGKLGK